MPFIKSNPSEFDGDWFRSTLEAKWAKFFKENGVRYEYEPKQLDLGIDKYTPDFWLSEYKTWIEIKPYPQYRPHSKCYRLSIESKRQVLLVQGYPKTDTYCIDLFDCRSARTFAFRKVVSEEQIKPTRTNLKFKFAKDSKKLTLVDNEGVEISLNG